MEIRVYITQEIDVATWLQIAEGFNQSFESRNTTKDHLVEGSINNEFGFSYHALGFESDKVIAFNTIHPFRYYYGDIIVNVGLSGSTYTLKEYRKDIFIFSKLYSVLVDRCMKDGFTYFLGVPNENSYMYSIKFLGCKEVGKLSYYILPLRLSKVVNKPKLWIMDFISLPGSYMWCIISSIFSFFIRGKESIKYNRVLVSDTFLDKRFPSKYYESLRIDNYSYFYKIVDEDGCKCAYIMDFRKEQKKNVKALSKCIFRILFNEKVDAIIYIGTMNLCQLFLIKVPHKFDPKPLRLTYRMLENNYLAVENMENIKDWDFSLLNLDVR